MKSFQNTVIISSLLALGLSGTQPLRAVPSFARKYATSCLTCHVAPPKLNAFGRAFRNRGYRMPGDDEQLVKQPEVSLGAPAWKRVWPEGVWPSSIPGGEFFAVALDDVGFEVAPDEEVTNSFDGVGEISLKIGGTLGETFSFFGDIGLFENGGPGHLGRLFAQYNHPSGLLNLKFGQFEPRAAPFSNHLRLIRSSVYLTNVFPTVPAGNFFGFSPNQRGIEVWGVREGPGGKGGVTWSFGVVNGNVGGAADALEDSALGETIDLILRAQAEHGNGVDFNSEKDVYFNVAYKIGGLGVRGSGGEGVLQQTNNWRDNSLTIGAYYYRGTTGFLQEEHHEGEEPEAGHEDHQDAARWIAPPVSRILSVGHGGGEPLPEDVEFIANGNTFYRAGVKFDAWIWDLNVFGAWQRNHDRLTEGRGVFQADITMLEANYVTPWPWLQPGIRFERVQPDWAPTFDRFTPSLTMMLRANVVLAIDGVLSGDQAPNLPPFTDRFRAALRVYF